MSAAATIRAGRLLALPLAAATTPAMAASGPAISLSNTDFVVLIAFAVFVGALVYLKVPRLVAGLLDKRSDAIREELDAARATREEAQSVLAEYESKGREIEEHARKVVEHAREEARLAAEAAKEDLKDSMARRMAAAEEQIESARARAVREIRDEAVAVAVGAARSVIAGQMTEARAGALVDESIRTVAAKLH